jgi:biotin synthase
MTTQTVQFSRRQHHPESNIWSVAEIEALLALPFMELVFRAAEIHRQFFDPTKVQLDADFHQDRWLSGRRLLPAVGSSRYAGGKQPMMTVDEVIDAARTAKANGAGRFCMGAAWRGPKDADLEQTLRMVSEVKSLGLETCATFGLLKDGQAEKLKQAGLTITTIIWIPHRKSMVTSSIPVSTRTGWIRWARYAVPVCRCAVAVLSA